MAIRVIIAEHLRRYVDGQGVLELDGWAGRPVRELLDELGIPSPVVGAVLIDGKLVRKDSPLQNGTEVKLIPLLGGG